MLAWLFSFLFLAVITRLYKISIYTNIFIIHNAFFIIIQGNESEKMYKAKRIENNVTYDCNAEVETRGRSERGANNCQKPPKWCERSFLRHFIKRFRPLSDIIGTRAVFRAELHGKTTKHCGNLLKRSARKAKREKSGKWDPLEGGMFFFPH